MDENFDYLSLKDLEVFGQTCKCSQQAVCQFYHKNFAIRACCYDGNIWLENYQIQTNCFHPFVRRILMIDGNLRFFQSNQFKSLKEIEFYDGQLRAIENVIQILPSLETVKFVFCRLNGEVHETILKFCKHLKHLYVRDNDSNGMSRYILIGTSNDWLTKHYPTLEHFEINSQHNFDEVIEFLRINSNIRTFSTTIKFLIANMRSIQASNIKLDVLTILHTEAFISNSVLNQFMSQLTALRNKGFFQQLHLYFYLTRKEYDYPVHLLALVTTLHRRFDHQPFILSPLVNLERLYLSRTNKIHEFDATLTKLTKLKFIHFRNIAIDTVLPFIRSMPHLREIIIDSIENLTNNSLNSSALNNERKVLKRAGKITIYVEEKIYLGTKEACHDTSIGLIEIKRHESHDESHDFVSFNGVIG